MSSAAEPEAQPPSPPTGGDYAPSSAARMAFYQRPAA